MRQKSGPEKRPAEDAIKDVREGVCNMNADDSDRADAIFQDEKKRWDAPLRKLRQQFLKDAERPLTRDQQIVEDVLEIIGGAVTIEDGIERPISRGDVEGALYHMRQAIETTRRVRERGSKQSLQAMEQRALELAKATEVGLPKEARAYLWRRIERLAIFVEALRRKPKPDAIEKRLAADFALDLCERFGVAVTTTREGKFCLVAAALYRDPYADLQYHCREALSKKPSLK